MKLTGTLIEWLKRKPDANLSHPLLKGSFNYKGVKATFSLEVSNFKYHPKGIECTYHSGRPDGEPWIYWFESGCPYLVKGLVYWTAMVFGGAGGAVQPLPSWIAESHDWHEAEVK